MKRRISSYYNGDFWILALVMIVILILFPWVHMNLPAPPPANGTN
ncbi:MAG TPA: hypothetical protein VFE61_05380 [Candidatus Sulfotelmatobacter sp.]|nr:hypothetical protein [Candidatus Sulfotelmatobacter sp.]